MDAYLTKYSSREDDEDFYKRKEISAVIPAAKNTLLDIRNKIFRRVQEVTRVSDNIQFLTQIAGKDGGVNGSNASMLHFIGMDVLTEMLAMRYVGVLISRSGDVEIGSRPNAYLSVIKREAILEYSSINEELVMVQFLLNTELITLEKKNGVVIKTVKKDEKVTKEVLDIQVIPFVIAEIQDSLFKDSADMQIALTNLNSADVSFLYRANFPIYTEQTNKGGKVVVMDSNGVAKKTEIDVGAVTGRTYAPGTDRPGFIAPPTEPVEISMKKQIQIEEYIEKVMHLSLMQGTELDGVSALCMVLEKIERQIVSIWQIYDNFTAVITYPQSYIFKTEEDKRLEAKELRDIALGSPSLTAQKEILKIIHKTLLEGKIPEDKINDIYKEIDSAIIVLVDPKTIREDVEQGFLSGKLAAQARQYPETDYELALTERIDRIEATAVAQSSGTRGIEDTNSLKQAKADKDGKPTRGEAK